MSIQKKIYHKATRPGEYVAFFVMQIPTKEGMGHIFMACDAFSEFGFVTGTEPDENPETVLKHINLLTEDREFKRHSRKGFTLIFDRYEELTDRINEILVHKNGKAMFNSGFHSRVAAPLMNGMMERFGIHGARYKVRE